MSHIKLNAAQPIVGEDGTMQDAFRTWALTVSDGVPQVGVGSPEGVVESPQFTLYIDSAGSAGNIEWRKMSSDIGGDKSKGWLQV